MIIVTKINDEKPHQIIKDAAFSLHYVDKKAAYNVCQMYLAKEGIKLTKLDVIKLT